MRRLVPLLVLALTATGCADGGPTAAPATTPAVLPGSEPVPPAGGGPQAGLVYATDTGVYALPRDGTPRRIASVPDVRDIAVSAAGRYVAWVAGRDRVTIGVHDLGGGAFREWRAPDLDARELGLTSGGFVTVDEGETPRLLRFDPDAMLRGGEPEATPIRGVGSVRLLAAAGDRILVAKYGDGGDTVYDVGPRGDVTRLFEDDHAIPSRGVRRLPLRSAALTRGGRRLVYGTAMRGTGDDDECTLDYGAAVRDLSTGRAVPMAPTPSLGDDVWTLVQSVTTGVGGRTVVGFGTEMQSCGGQPLRGAAYAVEGTRWTLVARGATWAATGPDGDLATISAEGVLTVGKRRVATGVLLAAWAPAEM